VARAGTTQVVVEVEPWVLTAGAGAEMCEKPTAVPNAGANVATDAGETGRWGCDGTPFGTSVEQYQIELPQPSSSCSPYGRRSYHPR
jgi:hypothetical protein